MNFNRTEQASGRRFAGIGTVAVLHVLVIYALLTGLAKKVVDIVKPPVDTKVIEEVKKPPPPPDMPVLPPPRLEAPPPPFIPPPEVQIAAPPPPPQATVSATTSTPPPPSEVRPAPPAAPPKPALVSMAIACPRMVSPSMPARAVAEEISGSVTARATIRNGKVVAVEILKAQPRGVFEAAVRAAMLQYQCQSTGEQDVQAVQDFTFRND